MMGKHIFCSYSGKIVININNKSCNCQVLKNVEYSFEAQNIFNVKIKLGSAFISHIPSPDLCNLVACHYNFVILSRLAQICICGEMMEILLVLENPTWLLCTIATPLFACPVYWRLILDMSLPDWYYFE